MKPKTIKTVVAHSGGFHADDVFAVAAIFIVFENSYKIKIIRTRDQKKINGADFVVDVGGIYDKTKNRFDHHQSGGAGKRPNGIAYASFGLVWKKYGEKICSSSKVASALDRRLVQPIDAFDNGDMISTPLIKEVAPYTLSDLVSLFKPTWKEKQANTDKIFFKLVEMAKVVIAREIQSAKHTEDAYAKVDNFYRKAKDKRVLVLDDDYPQDVFSTFKKIIYIIFPDIRSNTWHVYAIRKRPNFFTARKDFPASWAGKRDVELQNITGVPDAIFCHNKRFIVVAKSLSGALLLARLALDN